MDLDYKKLAEAKKDDILRDLDELIAIDSSEDLNNTSKEYPVGPGPVKAMKKFLSFAERDGFHTKNVDNYAGRVDFGEGDQTLGIIGHMDVGKQILSKCLLKMGRSSAAEVLMTKGLPLLLTTECFY